MSDTYVTDIKETVELFCDIKNILYDCIGEHENNNLVTARIMMLLDEKKIEKDIKLRRALDQINYSSY